MATTFRFDPGNRGNYLLSVLFLLLYSFCTLSFAGSHATNKAIEYYKNGEYSRAKSILSGTDLTNDPRATYMMGAISLVDDEFGQTSKNIDNAIYWFEISANLNNPQAYHALGRTYEQRWLNNRNLDDYEKSKINYELAINNDMGLASSDLDRLVSSEKPDLSETDLQRLNEINSSTNLIYRNIPEVQLVSQAEDETSKSNIELSKPGTSNKLNLADDANNEAVNSWSDISAGIGAGVPYGVFGANINYQINDTFGLTVGAGLGFGAGVRYHPLKEVRDFRMTLYYGANTIIDDPVTNEYETYDGLSFGIGFGSLSDGWDFDLFYVVIPDEAKDRVDELELLGYQFSSGDTEDGVKLSFGYHW